MTRRNRLWLPMFCLRLVALHRIAGGKAPGVSLATALGAGTIDMEKVQVHPTGWVDPSDPKNPPYQDSSSGTYAWRWRHLDQKRKKAIL